MANKSTASSPAKKAYQHQEGTGSLFFDAPGASTLSGSFMLQGKLRTVTAEPANDKEKREYLRITGEGISGALYPNDRATEDRHPVKNGPIEIDRQKKRVAAWLKQTKTGENAGSDFLSLQISEIRAKAE